MKLANQRHCEASSSSSSSSGRGSNGSSDSSSVEPMTRHEPIRHDTKLHEARQQLNGFVDLLSLALSLARSLVLSMFVAHACRSSRGRLCAAAAISLQFLFGGHLQCSLLLARSLARSLANSLVAKTANQSRGRCTNERMSACCLLACLLLLPPLLASQSLSLSLLLR